MSNAYSVTIERNSTKIVSEYDQEIPQSQTADYPVAPDFPVVMSHSRQVDSLVSRLRKTMRINLNKIIKKKKIKKGNTG